MAEEDISGHYQVLQELGRKSCDTFSHPSNSNRESMQLIQMLCQQGAALVLFTRASSGQQARLSQSSMYAPILHFSHFQSLEADPIQIDLESSDDDIQEIQQEISVLSTCASPFVTQYKASFLRGHKLWIIMEFLGGGSCLDLVRFLLNGTMHLGARLNSVTAQSR